jgi:pimeloyl-ACP methyl ester carboxylesterase
MGAAILLQSLGAGADFDAVVAEASFASFREIAFDRGPAGRTIFRPLVESGLLWARIRHGAALGDASPEAAVAQTTVPVLLIHSRRDESVAYRHARILRSARPRRVALWTVDAPHTGAFGAAPDEFRRRVFDWLSPPSPGALP